MSGQLTVDQIERSTRALVETLQARGWHAPKAWVCYHGNTGRWVGRITAGGQWFTGDEDADVRQLLARLDAWVDRVPYPPGRDPAIVAAARTVL